jgi:hypothetical protein
MCTSAQLLGAQDENPPDNVPNSRHKRIVNIGSILNPLCCGDCFIEILADINVVPARILQIRRESVCHP